MEALARSRIITSLICIVAFASSGCTSGGGVAKSYSAGRAQAPDEKPAPVVPYVPAPIAPVTPAPPVTQTSSASPAQLDVGPGMTTQVHLVAMLGSDVVITDQEVWQMVRMRPDYRQGGVDHERVMFREELRKLIERELLVQDFLAKIKKQKPQVLEELKDQTTRAAQQKIRQLRKMNKFKTEAEFLEFLTAVGLNAKALQRHFEREEMKNIYVGQFMKDKEKFKSITLTEIERYYKAYPDEFKIEDRVKWLDLFVSMQRFATPEEARRYAEKLRNDATHGTDFVQIVKNSGHGDSVLRDGEGIGTKPGEILPRELEPAIMALSAGQVSDIVATSVGYHIVKVVERDKAGVKPFDEQTQFAIRAKLAQKSVEAEYEKLIDDLWRKTKGTVFDLP